LFCVPGLVFGGTECVSCRMNVLRAQTHFRRYRGRRVSFSCFALQDSISTVPRASVPVLMFCAPIFVFGGTEGVRTRFYVLRSRSHFRRYRARRVPFSRFARPDSFMAVPRASDPVLIFARPESFLAVPRASGPVFMFCGLRLVFWQYRGCRVPFSFFAVPDSFFAFLRLSGPVFLFCVPGLVFDGTKGDSSRINVLRAETHFRRYQERRVKFSCFALPDSLSAVSTATSPVFMFCAPRLIFDRNKGVGSHFQILRARTRFRRCQVR
jgi:hypothetical protein